MFQFHYFVLLLIIVDKFHHTSIMASIPSERFYNNNWIKIYKNNCFQVKQENINSIIIGDSIVAGLTRYTNIWNNIFSNSFINLGISGDRVENVLWRAREIPFIPSLKNVVILCGTNNINKDSPYDIAQGLIAIGSAFKNQPSNPNIFICGILPRDGYCSINRLIINEINDLLESICLVKSFHFINQNSGWTLNDGALNFSLFFSDGLHLVEKGILFASKRKINNIPKLKISYKNIQIKQHSKVTYLGCILDETMSGESMALKVINKINSRLKFLNRKKKINSSATQVTM